MAEFKPMVKMMTTEPSVELKLKKGGMVKKAVGGKMGKPMAMPARGGAPMAAAPMKPSLAERVRSMKGMPSRPGPAQADLPKSGSSMLAGTIGYGTGSGQGSSVTDARREMPNATRPTPTPLPRRMKKGGDMSQDKAMIKKAFKQHDSQEHVGGKGTSLKLKKGGMKMATGGVVMGQGGYATGGVVNGNGGGYATGGVAMANGGGYKMGGKASKKAYATGGTVDSGRAVAMPQGSKPASKPVSISQLSGTYKKGGRVAPGNRALQAVSTKENAIAMRQAKADSNEKYGKPKRFAGGGSSKILDESFFDKNKVDAKEVSDKASRELEEAMNPLSMIKEVGHRIKDAFTGEKNTYGPGGPKPVVPKGSVTKTVKSVTVAPGKKRGGLAC